MAYLLANDVILCVLLYCLIRITFKLKEKNSDMRNAAVQRARADRNKRILECLNTFLHAKQENRDFSEFFINKKIHSIAIYGMGFLGRRLCDELQEYKNIDVKYAIDKNAESMKEKIPVLGLDEEWKPVDAIIVTVIGSYNELLNTIFKDIECPIINIEDMLDYLTKEEGEND